MHANTLVFLCLCLQLFAETRDNDVNTVIAPDDTCQLWHLLGFALRNGRLL